MGAIPFWAVEGGQDGADYMDTPWDILFVEGVGVPGITECSGAPSMKADKQSPAGKNGGAPVIHGRKPAEFETSTRIWTPRQWDLWQAMQEVFWPKGGAGKVTAVDVSHPYLSNLRIKSGVCQGVIGPIPTGAIGERVVKVKWLEFVLGSKKNATKRPAGSSTALQVDPKFISSQAAADGTEIPRPGNDLQSLPSDNSSGGLNP